jgi:hypothetical protein
MRQIFRHAICKRSFEPIPDELVRIELGRICRELIDMESGMPMDKILGRGSFMWAPSIPEQNDMPSKMPCQMHEEANHLRAFDVLFGMESGIECNPSSFRGNSERRDSRYLGPMTGDTKQRSLSFRRPGSRDGRNGEKSAFIKKNQVRRQFFSLFLYGARHTVSSAEWPPRLVLEHVSVVSDNSSRVLSKSATRDLDGRLRQTLSRSLWQSSSASTGPWETPTTRPHPRVSSLRAPSGGDVAWEDDQEQVWLSTHRDRGVCTGPSIKLPNCEKTRSSARQPLHPCRSPKARWLACGASRAASDSRMVSCTKDIIGLYPSLLLIRR